MLAEEDIGATKQFDITTASRQRVLDMVKEEQKVRYSKGVQEAYTQQYYAMQNTDKFERVSIEIEIQKYILRQFGYSDDETSLLQYWKIPSTYWTDEEVKNSIFYMKLNMFQYPKVKYNDPMIDCGLIDFATKRELLLSSLETPGRPLVLLAGSMT